MGQVKEILDRHITVKIDRAFAAKVITYVERWKRKNEDTINFLGGNLLGQQAFVMTTEEMLYWVEEILQIDDWDTLDYEFGQVKDFYPEGLTKLIASKRFKVSGNPLNHSYFYIAHRALTDGILSESDAKKLASACINMVQYKFFSSMYTGYLPHKTVESIAMAVYEGLSRKWGIKLYGTWGNLFQSRTDDIIGPTSIHKVALWTMEDDYGLVKMINDVQGRLKSILLNLINEYKRVRALDARINSGSQFMNTDEGMIIKDSVNEYARFRERIHDIIPDRNKLIQKQLIEITAKTIDTVSERQLRDTLVYLSDNYITKSKKKKTDVDSYQKTVDTLMIYTLDLMRKEKIPLAHIPDVIVKLRSMFRSSRANDPLLKQVREGTGPIVTEALRTKSEGTVASVRIAVIIYIVLRALVDGI